MLTPRRALLASLAAVALAVAACGGGGDDGEEVGGGVGAGGAGRVSERAEASDELRQAGLDTLAVGPASLEGEVSIVPMADGGPEAVAFAIGGSIDLTTGQTALVLDLSHIYGDVEMAPEVVPYLQGSLVLVVQDGAIAYLCGDVYEAFAGTSCVREDAGPTPGASGAPGAFVTGLSFDVLLGLLGELEDVEDLGVERLVGTSLRRRTGTLDLAAAATGLPADARLALDRTLASLGTSTAEVAGPATVDVWVDGDGLVRQVALEVTKDGEGAATRTFTSRFVAFGVDPALPPISIPTDVTDATQVAWP